MNARRPIALLTCALLALPSLSGAQTSAPVRASGASAPHPAKRAFPQLELGERKSHGQRAIVGAQADDCCFGMGGSGGGMMMMDDMDMMGMGPMGGQKGMKMKMTAALPGFPGASHIYHIGATDFFLDHPEHITLSTEQKTKLGNLKQKATTDKATAQRKIEEAEQQLWELTAADQPDAGKIDAKVREVEKLRGDQRLAFIRSVGEAAQVLTDDQRKILLGLAPPTPSPHVHPKTP